MFDSEHINIGKPLRFMNLIWFELLKLYEGKLCYVIEGVNRSVDLKTAKPPCRQHTLGKAA